MQDLFTNIYIPTSFADELTSESRHLEVVHLGERDHERELVVLHVELEKRAAAYNL